MQSRLRVDLNLFRSTTLASPTFTRVKKCGEIEFPCRHQHVQVSKQKCLETAAVENITVYKSKRVYRLCVQINSLLLVREARDYSTGEKSSSITQSPLFPTTLRHVQLSAIETWRGDRCSGLKARLINLRARYNYRDSTLKIVLAVIVFADTTINR